MLAVFIFYNRCSGIRKFLSFSNKINHCNVAIFDGRSGDNWIIFDIASNGLFARAFPVVDGDLFLKSIRDVENVTATVAVEIHHRNIDIVTPLLASSCNEICRHIAGVETGFAFNPLRFFNKLKRFNELKNYSILDIWEK